MVIGGRLTYLISWVVAASLTDCSARLCVYSRSQIMASLSVRLPRQSQRGGVIAFSGQIRLLSFFVRCMSLGHSAGTGRSLRGVRILRKTDLLQLRAVRLTARKAQYTLPTRHNCRVQLSRDGGMNAPVGSRRELVANCVHAADADASAVCTRGTSVVEITAMTSTGHMTSSVTSPFDSACPLSYRLPIVNNPLPPVVFARHTRTKRYPVTHSSRRLGI